MEQTPEIDEICKACIDYDMCKDEDISFCVEWDEEYRMMNSEDAISPDEIAAAQK